MSKCSKSLGNYDCKTNASHGIPVQQFNSIQCGKCCARIWLFFVEMTPILILFHVCAGKLKHNQKESVEAFLINTYNAEAEREREIVVGECLQYVCRLLHMASSHCYFQEVKLMKSHRVHVLLSLSLSLSRFAIISWFSWNRMINSWFGYAFVRL